MARVLIVGGGFGGVVAAESLAKKLGSDHEITLAGKGEQLNHAHCTYLAGYARLRHWARRNSRHTQKDQTVSLRQEDPIEGIEGEGL